MTLYGYARVSVREPEDKNLDLQVERLVRAGCSLDNIRAEEASGARNDRGGLLELLDLLVEGDTLVVAHIDRLSRGLTHGLQAIEGLHRAGVEFRSLSEDFDTATATGKLQLTMVLAFSEWWRNSIRERSVAGQAKARAEGRFPGHRHTASHSSSHRCPFAHSGGGVQAAAAGNRRGGPGRGRSGRGGGPALGELFHEVVIIYYHELSRAPKPSFGGFGIRQPPPQQPCPPAAGTRAARASRPTPDALTIVAKYTSGKSAGDAARWLE